MNIEIDAQSIIEQIRQSKTLGDKDGALTPLIKQLTEAALQAELVHHERFKTRAEANQAIFEYIEVFYNRQRLHSTNGYMSPVNYELKMLEYQRLRNF